MGRWRISAKWASKPFDCTVRGIVTQCHGDCCWLPSYWPARVFRLRGDTACAHRGPRGCLLTEPDRPLDCLLYPLIFNNAGTLVLHNRALLPNWVCKGCAKVGSPLIVSAEPSLSAIFGQAQYVRVMRSVLAGQDGFFEPSEAVLIQRDVEIICAQHNLPPIPRTQITAETLLALRAQYPAPHEGQWWKPQAQETA